ncbi:putative MFS transporter [Stipitochalara longipes BDJ]|nr:putative MFS transporter [Stipitochalara longipes BDJ]
MTTLDNLSDGKSTIVISATSDSEKNTELSDDGSLEGWTCVIGGWFALFATFGWLNCMGIFQTYYEQALLSQYSASDISWIFTTQLFLMWSGGAMFGRIIDTYGTKWIAIICTIACTFFVCMLSLSTEYYQIFLTQGVGFGLAASGLFSCGLVSVGQHFHRRKALALGIVLAGSSTGGVIHPIYLHFLIPKIGFPYAIRVNALIIFSCGVVSCVLMKTRLPRKEWDKTAKYLDFSLFKHRIFSIYCLGTFFVVWGLFSTWNYLPTMSLRHNFSNGLAIYTIVVLNGSSIIGRILPAYLADRFGRFNSISIISILNAILLLAFWLPLEVNPVTTHLQVFALSAMAGFATGACISVFMPCVAELGPVESLGTRFGMYQAVIGFGGLTSLPIQGTLIPQDHGSFSHLIIFSGICVLGGSMIICLARMLRVGCNWKG